jgi:RNA polymerase sigma factor (sigma-70 family)
MPSGKSGVFTEAIQVLFDVGTIAGLTDGQLLERFAAQNADGGEAAFTALVARHGPMVMSVCESLLGDAHDAEDAFQATFLVLAKKSRSVRDPELLGNWLFGVARRTAQKARALRRRWNGRAAIEGTMATLAVASNHAEGELLQREQSAAVHAEVDRLPQSLRAPIVLCYLEGLTHDEAARLLRWPVGTVRSRMARARGLLRARLIRRGLVCSAIAAALEFPRATAAGVPRTLGQATASLANALAIGAPSKLVSPLVTTLIEDVQKRMFVTQLKRIVATALVAAGIATGAGTIALAALLAQPFAGRSGGPAADPAVAQRTGNNADGVATTTRELLALQERTRSSARTALPSVVSLPGSTAVIIAPEGLILSQAHATHGPQAKAGAKTKVTLHDGTVADAELLGADRVHDLSLLRLVKPGPYPFSPPADRNLSPSERVLKMGYPAPLWY